MKGGFIKQELILVETAEVNIWQEVLTALYYVKLLLLSLTISIIQSTLRIPKCFLCFLQLSCLLLYLSNIPHKIRILKHPSFPDDLLSHFLGMTLLFETFLWEVVRILFPGCLGLAPDGLLIKLSFKCNIYPMQVLLRLNE